MTTATTGTGTIVLGSAVSPYLTFASAGAVNGDVISYSIVDGSNSEIGTGTYSSAGPTLTRNVTTSTNANAAISLSGSAVVRITPRAEDLLIAPTFQKFTTGTSATYTTPVNCTYIKVTLVGGGSGGAGGGSGGGNSTSGGSTTFSTLTAGGGALTTLQINRGLGGTGTGGDDNISGSTGDYGGPSNVIPGGHGGQSTRTGAGAGGAPGANSAADAAVANSGSGGGGGSTNNVAFNVGAGGSAGATVIKIITAPASSYTYTVGAGGSAGAAGTAGTAGGAGSAGFIYVEEYYN